MNALPTGNGTSLQGHARTILESCASAVISTERDVFHSQVQTNANMAGIGSGQPTLARKIWLSDATEENTITVRSV